MTVAMPTQAQYRAEALRLEARLKMQLERRPEAPDPCLSYEDVRRLGLRRWRAWWGEESALWANERRMPPGPDELMLRGDWEPS